MIDEIASHGPAEIHSHLDAWVGTRAGPVRNLIGIPPLVFAGGDLLAVYLQHQEMDLMDMEVVDLKRAVLDRPILYSPFGCCDGGGAIGVVDLGVLPIDNDKEF